MRRKQGWYAEEGQRRLIRILGLCVSLSQQEIGSCTKLTWQSLDLLLPAIRIAFCYRDDLRAPKLASGQTGDGTWNLFAIDKRTGERVGAVEIPGATRYGMSSWVHEGKQYVIIQLADGLAAMALP